VKCTSCQILIQGSNQGGSDRRGRWHTYNKREKTKMVLVKKT
jgi:hypothetical protein